MGLFKRFFSLGSKKGKQVKSSITHASPSETGIVTKSSSLGKERTSRPDDELAASRLLRSSSAHYKVVKEFDYTSPPPLPIPPMPSKPCNLPSSSSPPSPDEEPVRRAPKSSYSVTVYPRQKHTATEFPHAYHEDSISSDTSQVLALRADPSVTDLLNMFDGDGQIPLFNNSPPRVGKAQLQRNGSTLRQLLGDPTCDDLSWAERCLGERDSSSSCSTSIRTPSELGSHFDHSRSEVQASRTFGVDDDSNQLCTSDDSFDEHSHSMTTGSDISKEIDMGEPQILRRASQVFSFLYAKPSIIETTSDRSDSPAERPPSASEQAVESMDSSSPVSPSTSSGSPQQFEQTPDTSIQDCATVEKSLDSTYDLSLPSIEDLEAPPLSPTMPLTVLVTAPTPQLNGGRTSVSRIPIKSPGRVPSSIRPAHAQRRSSHPYAAPAPPPSPHREEIADRSSSYDPFTAVPTRQRRKTRHKASASTGSILMDTAYYATPAIPFMCLDVEKENVSVSDPGSAPSTPVRARVLAVDRPSPASSVELSPVGRQMMVNLRHQRMQARALEREKLRGGHRPSA